MTPRPDDLTAAARRRQSNSGDTEFRGHQTQLSRARQCHNRVVYADPLRAKPDSGLRVSFRSWLQSPQCPSGVLLQCRKKRLVAQWPARLLVSAKEFEV